MSMKSLTSRTSLPFGILVFMTFQIVPINGQLSSSRYKKHEAGWIKRGTSYKHRYKLLNALLRKMHLTRKHVTYKMLLFDYSIHSLPDNALSRILTLVKNKYAVRTFCTPPKLYQLSKDLNFLRSLSFEMRSVNLIRCV